VNLSRGARELLAHLRSYGSQIFPKQDTLARKLDLGLRTINRYICELKKAGLLEVEPRGPSSSSYRVISQQPAEQIGVACEIEEKPQELVEIPVENMRNGVACGVAFGVARPPYLLMRGLSSFVLVERKLIAGGDGFVPIPKNPTPPSDGLEPPGLAIVSRKTQRKPPEPDPGWSRSIADSVARLAAHKALGSGP
jgi:hypothetical protein